MENKKVSSVLRGSLDNLPITNSRIVRIFISSTFTDTQEERNLLIEDVHPKLSKYCKEKYGLEYQVVDMRWGVPEEAADDHSAATLCMQEIKNCQRLSTGPNFVTFLNQRHGFHHLQPKIASKEFEYLLTELRDTNENTDILTLWYQQDLNCIPPEHIIQPISAYIPEYREKTPDSVQEWNRVYKEILRLLRKASKSGVEKKIISEEDAHKYFLSVTEEEIIHGIFNHDSKPSEECLCFVRIIEDIDNHLNHPKAWRFIDMIEGQTVDSEAQTILKRLRDQSIVEKMNFSNIERASVQWSEKGGIHKEDHKSYLQKFGHAFYVGIKNRIDRAVLEEHRLSQEQVYLEVLHHATMASQRNAMFHGREKELDHLREYLTSNSDEPFTVYGPSGSGKTSILAEVAKQIPYSFNKDAVVVLRFLGTSPDSSNLFRLLTSLCKQIIVNFNENTKVPEEYEQVLALFSLLLEKSDQRSPKKLVIILDSLDQLTSDYNAHKLKWLPRKLSKNVKFVVSAYTDSTSIITGLKSMYKPDSFLMVKVLGEELSIKIIKSWLENRNRTLTDEQFSMVQKAFKICSLPLYVKLVFEDVLTWKSYSVVGDEYLAKSVQSSIVSLLLRLEAKHGRTFITHTIAYITASQTGISEIELEDVLSLDDVCLTEVFKFHVPPMRRVPSLLLVRLKNDISSYLSVKEIDGTRVLFWYHRQFIETTQERYLKKVEFKKMIYTNLADYFDGTWHGRPKPFQYTPYQMKKLGLSSANNEADRKVSAQPLTFIHTEDNIEHVRYNLRKINKLPTFLWMSENIKALQQCCLFNFEWISTKLKATGVDQLLTDYTMTVALNRDNFLYKILNTSRSTLRKHTQTLTMEIAGHMLPLLSTSRDVNERKIVEESLKEKQSTSHLLPYQTCYHTLNPALCYKFEHTNFPFGLQLLALSSDSKHLLALDTENVLMSWDLESGVLESQAEIYNPDVCKMNIMTVLHDENLIVFCTSNQKQHNPVLMVDMTTADIKESLELSKNYPAVGFTDSLKFGFTTTYILCMHVGHSADIFLRSSGELSKKLDIIPASMEVLPGGERVIFHVKNTTNYQIVSLKTLGLTLELECLQHPQQIVLEPSGNDGYVLLKNSPILEVFNLDSRKELKTKSMESFNVSGTLSDDSSSNIMNISMSINKEYLILKLLNAFVLRDMKRNHTKYILRIPESVKADYKTITHMGQLTVDSKYFIASYEGHIVVWDTRTSRVKRTIDVSRSQITCIALSLDGQFLVTTSKRNNYMSVWRISLLATSSSISEPLMMPTYPRYVCLDAKGNKAVIRGHKANEIAILDVRMAVIKSFLPGTHEVMVPSITPDGQLAVLREYESDKVLKLWDTDSSTLVSSLPLPSLLVKLYHVTNTRLAVGVDRDGLFEVSIWTIPDMEMILSHSLGPFVSGDGFILSDNDMKHILVPVPITTKGAIKSSAIVDLCKIDVTENKSRVICSNIMSNRTQLLSLEHNTVLLSQSVAAGTKMIVMDFVAEKVVRENELKIVHEYSIDEYSIMDINSLDCRLGIDKARRLYDLNKLEIVCEFDREGEYPKGPTRFNCPKMSRDGNCAIWVNVLAGLVMVGDTNVKSVVNICPIHGVPLTLNVSPDNLVLVGCEDGRLMMLELVDGNQDGDYDENFISKFLNRHKRYTLRKSKNDSLYHKPQTKKQKSSVCNML